MGPIRAPLVWLPLRFRKEMLCDVAHERLDTGAVGIHVEGMSDKPSARAFYESDSLGTELYDALAASIIPGSSMEGDI